MNLFARIVAIAVHNGVDHAFAQRNADLMQVVLIKAQMLSLAQDRLFGAIDALEVRIKHLFQSVGLHALVIRHKSKTVQAEPVPATGPLPQGKLNRYIRIVGIKKSRVGKERRWLAGMAGPLLFVLLAAPQYGQTATDMRQSNLASFDTVWSTIRDKHWEKDPGGLDWQAIRQEYRPRVEQATSSEDARDVIRQMLGRLHQTHFAIFPSVLYQDLNAVAAGDGWPGFDARVLDGRVIVTEGPALRQGLEIRSVDGAALQPLLDKLLADASVHELQLERAVAARMGGAVGQTRKYAINSGNGIAGNSTTSIDLTLRLPRGQLAGFGNLPPQPVWFESKRLANTGYIRFNLFLDLPRLMPEFGEAVQQCSRCDGLIIDLRGNPGGIGAMAMGMAGWLVDKPGQRLGTMYMRGATLNFVINPRTEAYTGPVAILVDGSSASTSEIFAGGLQDLGRARIFGTRTAGAALPSVITLLPNGDGFQYAVANYISQGGKALEANGVIPNQEVKLTRETLLAGHDAVVEAALDWIQKQKDKK